MPCTEVKRSLSYRRYQVAEAESECVPPLSHPFSYQPDEEDATFRILLAAILVYACLEPCSHEAIERSIGTCMLR